MAVLDHTAFRLANVQAYTEGIHYLELMIRGHNYRDKCLLIVVGKTSRKICWC